MLEINQEVVQTSIYPEPYSKELEEEIVQVYGEDLVRGLMIQFKVSRERAILMLSVAP